MDHVVDSSKYGGDDDYSIDDDMSGDDAKYTGGDGSDCSSSGWVHTLLIAILVVVVLLIAYHIYCSMSKKSVCRKQMAYAKHFFGMSA